MLKNTASKIINDAAVRAFGPGMSVAVDWADPEFGDFSSNAGFVLASRLSQMPNKIATAIADQINDPDIARASAAEGYVNISFKDDVLIRSADRISEPLEPVKAPRKIQIEFISANPTGPLTLGNARGGYIGDVLSRLLKAKGHKAVSEYYFNDAGTQIKHLVHSVKSASSAQSQQEQADIQYKGEYIERLAANLGQKVMEIPDEELGRILTKQIFQSYITPAISKMGIEFDEWTNESELDFESVRIQLEQKGLLEDRDGALWLRSASLGDDREARVLRKTNGDVTYLGNDLAYHFEVFGKRGFDQAVKVWGADHAGQIKSLTLTLKQFFPDIRLDIVLVQWVRLLSGGQEVKMSKRAGTFVTVDELITEVGADVARFFFLLRDADSQMDFDLDQAKEQSAKNPLWYLMYSNARAHSILAKAKEKGLIPGAQLEKLDAKERSLMFMMSKFYDLADEVSASFEVQKLAYFGVELARAFHDYYESTKIIDLPLVEAKNKLYIVQRYEKFFSFYCSIMGLTPQPMMQKIKD